jgi:hypothetical protein
MSKKDVVDTFQEENECDLYQWRGGKEYIDQIEAEQRTDEFPVQDWGVCDQRLTNEEGKEEYVADQDERECNHNGGLSWVLEEKMMELNQILI